MGFSLPGEAPRRTRRAFIAAVLAVCLNFAAPGLTPYAAAASAFQGAGKAAGVPGVPALGAVPTPLGAPAAGVLPGGPGALPGIPGAAIPGVPNAAAIALPGPAAGPSAIPGAIPVLPGALPAGAGVVPGRTSFPGQTPAAPLSGPDSRAILEAGAGELGRAENDGQRSNTLSGLFDKSFAKPGSDGAGAVAGAAAPPQAALSAPSVESAKAVAADRTQKQEDRLAAVKAIADFSGDPAKLALAELGGYDAEASAADYEVKRAALRALAEKGTVLSLPPVSERHAAEILAKLSAQKPEALAIDYDKTLEDNDAPAAPATGAALQAAAEAGTEIMVLTGRPDRASYGAGKGILDSLSTLSKEQLAAFTVGADRGARVLQYDQKRGWTVTHESPPWTESELRALSAAASQVFWKFQAAAVRGQTTTQATSYRFTAFLRRDITRPELDAAAALMREQLQQLGLGSYRLEARMNYNDEDNQPNLTVAKVEKDEGVRSLRRKAESFLRRRDGFRLLPDALQKLGGRLLGRLPGRIVPAASTLIVGDRFFGEHTIDAPMLAGAPGALAISVGGSADPRLANIFVWPRQAGAGSRELLGAIAAPAPAGEKLDKKALTGLFTQRTISIVAFILTNLAFPFIAIPIAGVGGFSALMAFGTLAAIAMGPVNAMITRKLSARNAMALNGVIRVLLSAALPLFAALGVLNFPTLLIASIANGWLMSSIMTTEGVYIKRLAGSKLGAINSLIWINYLFIQVMLGIIAKVGRFIDGSNLMIPYYVSIAAHVLLIIPIIWKTIPNDKPQLSAKEAADTRGALAKLREWAPGFAKRYWKEAVAFGAGLALYPVLGSTLPAAVALVYWITRTDGFAKLWKLKAARNGLLLSAAVAFLFFPIQNLVLPVMAETLAGKSGKSELLGQLIGALFFGQFIATAAQAKLARLRLPLVGRFGAEKLVQAVVLGLAATWVYLTLFPGSLAAVAAALAVGTGLTWLSGKMTDRGWLQYFGFGFAALALPALFWGSVPVLFASILAMGLAYGPANVALSTYFFRNVPRESSEEIIGIQGSIFNAAITLGFGAFGLLSTLWKPPVPAMLWPVVAMIAAVGLAFLFAPKLLPGLPKTGLKPKEE